MKDSQLAVKITDTFHDHIMLQYSTCEYGVIAIPRSAITMGFDDVLDSAVKCYGVVSNDGCFISFKALAHFMFYLSRVKGLPPGIVPCSPYEIVYNPSGDKYFYHCFLNLNTMRVQTSSTYPNSGFHVFEYFGNCREFINKASGKITKPNNITSYAWFYRPQTHIASVFPPSKMAVAGEKAPVWKRTEGNEKFSRPLPLP